MSKPHLHKPPTGRTNLASCIVATISLIFFIIIIFIVYFSVFKPRDPNLAVHAVQIPAFSAANSTVRLTFSQYVTVHNPNRAAFTHYDSSLQLLYAGRQVGFMFIPAGKIASGKTQYMAATFSVQPFPLSPAADMGLPPATAGLGMEVESRIEMAGRVRILRFFTHHVVARSKCRVAIAVSDGSVSGVHCS